MTCMHYWYVFIQFLSNIREVKHVDVHVYMRNIIARYISTTTQAHKLIQLHVTYVIE